MGASAPFFSRGFMETVSLQDEKIVLDDFCAPETAADHGEAPAAAEPKKRGRPKKVESMTPEEKELHVEEEKARLAGELKDQVTARKKRAPLNIWFEKNGKKVLKFTRTAEGNVYRELSNAAAMKKA